ncbi:MULTISPECIES: hypothetical protein [Streptomyces]|uniref:hypothetical protein n=1 Tax=Streptomyces TaxID=1883 RepID=UPI000C27FE8F|nr:hypothetical protein [Streptomyces sp. CB02120-2]PJN19280.1 hypothetical protein CG724_11050 [Streptomyces sp. CB02120-2]
MADTQPTKARRQNLTVRRDAALDADLATLARAGLSTSEAVRFAVAFVAHGYRDLWASGLHPDGVAPRRIAMRTELHHQPQAPDLRVVRTAAPSTTPEAAPQGAAGAA